MQVVNIVNNAFLLMIILFVSSFFLARLVPSKSAITLSITGTARQGGLLGQQRLYIDHPFPCISAFFSPAYLLSFSSGFLLVSFLLILLFCSVAFIVFVSLFLEIFHVSYFLIGSYF
ncbi:MAG: hypothetical protein EU981_04090 [Candidatus Liberibacter ctenarytainae]|uniref:Transmembrane protein n=1 Tax=Candidatus Liberibacter ctenarytainae TaxID=2020335 RepID=A0A937DM77_9HYPH|nr:hypothetical protein [Candidatus Liberibacter ctenarytainae]